jgi:hypothetical protein
LADFKALFMVFGFPEICLLRLEAGRLLEVEVLVLDDYATEPTCVFGLNVAEVGLIH